MGIALYIVFIVMKPTNGIETIFINKGPSQKIREGPPENVLIRLEGASAHDGNTGQNG